MKLVSLENLQYFGSKVNELLDTKVAKVDGYSLTKNDLTDALKANYDAAYAYSQEDHAPVDAEKNVIVGVKVNGVDLAVDGERKVDVAVPTALSQLSEDDTHKVATAEQLTQIGTNKTDLATLKADGGEGSIKKMISDAINTFATEITEDGTINTYKEVIDWIATHGAEFAELVGEVDNKVDKVAGKGLSTNDITDELKANYDAAYTHSTVVTGNPHGVTASDLGLAKVENKTASEILDEIDDTLIVEKLGYTPLDSATLEKATADKDGLLSKEDFSKLASLEIPTEAEMKAAIDAIFA